MSLGALHYNYLFVGKKYCELTLLNDDVFLLIMDAISPLLTYTNIKKGRILSEQHVNQSKIKLGKPRWEKEAILQICKNYKQYLDNDSFHFGFLTAEFPSIESAYKQKETVDIYLHVENDLYWGKIKSDGDCGLFISLREDIFQAAGETLVMQVLRNIYEIFDEAKILFYKRSWWSNSENEESAMQDVAPWRFIDKLCTKKYSKWSELDLNTLLSEKL